MQITGIKVEIVDPKHNPFLLAVFSVVFDNEFVLHEIKLIQGRSGKCFVSMPGRKRREGCISCRKQRNDLDASFCSRCGDPLQRDEARYRDSEGRSLLYLDICHPIAPEFRFRLEQAIFSAYSEERTRLFSRGIPDLPPSNVEDFDEPVFDDNMVGSVGEQK